MQQQNATSSDSSSVFAAFAPHAVQQFTRGTGLTLSSLLDAVVFLELNEYLPLVSALWKDARLRVLFSGLGSVGKFLQNPPPAEFGDKARVREALRTRIAEVVHPHVDTHTWSVLLAGVGMKIDPLLLHLNPGENAKAPSLSKVYEQKWRWEQQERFHVWALSVPLEEKLPTTAEYPSLVPDAMSKEEAEPTSASPMASTSSASSSSTPSSKSKRPRSPPPPHPPPPPPPSSSASTSTAETPQSKKSREEVSPPSSPTTPQYLRPISVNGKFIFYPIQIQPTDAEKGSASVLLIRGYFDNTKLACVMRWRNMEPHKALLFFPMVDSPKMPKLPDIASVAGSDDDDWDAEDKLDAMIEGATSNQWHAVWIAHDSGLRAYNKFVPWEEGEIEPSEVTHQRDIHQLRLLTPENIAYATSIQTIKKELDSKFGEAVPVATRDVTCPWMTLGQPIMLCRSKQFLIPYHIFRKPTSRQCCAEALLDDQYRVSLCQRTGAFVDLEFLEPPSTKEARLRPESAPPPRGSSPTYADLPDEFWKEDHGTANTNEKFVVELSWTVPRGDALPADALQKWLGGGDTDLGPLFVDMKEPLNHPVLLARIRHALTLAPRAELETFRQLSSDGISYQGIPPSPLVPISLGNTSIFVPWLVDTTSTKQTGEFSMTGTVGTDRRVCTITHLSAVFGGAGWITITHYDTKDEVPRILGSSSSDTCCPEDVPKRAERNDEYAPRQQHVFLHYDGGASTYNYDTWQEDSRDHDDLLDTYGEDIPLEHTVPELYTKINLVSTTTVHFLPDLESRIASSVNAAKLAQQSPSEACIDNALPWIHVSQPVSLNDAWLFIPVEVHRDPKTGEWQATGASEGGHVRLTLLGNRGGVRDVAKLDFLDPRSGDILSPLHEAATPPPVPGVPPLTRLDDGKTTSLVVAVNHDNGASLCGKPRFKKSERAFLAALVKEAEMNVARDDLQLDCWGAHNAFNHPAVVRFLAKK